jgi:hypothetical protein
MLWGSYGASLFDQSRFYEHPAPMEPSDDGLLRVGRSATMSPASSDSSGSLAQVA